MSVGIGPDGKARKERDVISELDRHSVLEVPEEWLEAVALLRQKGYSDEEIQRELDYARRGDVGFHGDGSRIPPISSYQPPPAPLSQQTMDRLHVPAHKEVNNPVEWAYKGEAIRHRQFLQTDGAGVQEMEKNDLTLALIGGKGGGFSAAEDLAYIFFNKQLAQKSRVDLGGIPERLATVAQYNISKQMFEETPERPKSESKGFLRGLLGR